MTQTDTSQTIEHLKRFLIIRLLAVMVFIFACEAIINLIVIRIMFPVFNTLFGTELIFTNQSAGESIILLLRMASYLLLTGINILLPNGLAGIFSYISAGLWKNSNLLTGMSGTEQMLIFVVLFVFICLYLLPYMVGILYYSGIVVRKMEEVREYDRRQQEAFARKRNLLLSDITHDLKTPITAVKGYVEGIMDGVADTPEKMDRYVRTIYNKTNEMDHLINELTFYSKIDTNRIPYTFSKLNVEDYFEDCSEEVGLELETRGIELVYANYVEKDVMVIADGEQIRRVIHNIISNAIKYMDKPKGIIQIRIKDVGDFIQIEIEDNGKGIGPKDLPYIFDRFYRTDVSRNSSKGGSGIGLSIVKKILEDHGGKVWATSRLGIGTIMYFVLRKYQEVPMK